MGYWIRISLKEGVLDLVRAQHISPLTQQNTKCKSSVAHNPTETNQREVNDHVLIAHDPMAANTEPSEEGRAYTALDNITTDNTQSDDEIEDMLCPTRPLSRDRSTSPSCNLLADIEAQTQGSKLSQLMAMTLVQTCGDTSEHATGAPVNIPLTDTNPQLLGEPLIDDSMGANDLDIVVEDKTFAHREDFVRQFGTWDILEDTQSTGTHSVINTSIMGKFLSDEDTFDTDIHCLDAFNMPKEWASIDDSIICPSKNSQAPLKRKRSEHDSGSGEFLHDQNHT